MKILLYSNQGLAPLHLGIELEIIEKMRAEGHEFFIVTCNNVLEGCFFNPCHNVLGCAICEARSSVFYSKIGIKKEQLFSLKSYPEKETIEFPFFKTLEELLHYGVDGINLGRGVASSIISLRRNADINSNTENDFIGYQLRMAYNVYLNFSYFINEIKPDAIYFFNGRFAECFPLIGLAQKHNLPYTTIEVSSSKHRYELFQNSLPHSIKKRVHDMEVGWDRADPMERDKTAIKWYEEKRKGTVQTGIVFTHAQKTNQLPENWDSSKLNISVFNSSEDEMKVIEEWELDLYPSQNEVITKLAQYFKNDKNIHFWLRVHPNLETVDNIQSREIKEMSFENLTVIPASASVDTYALMEACDKVITFGSTTGIEATYWQKPSILFGKSFYYLFDCVYRAINLEELYSLVEQKHLPPKPKPTTFKFAYYMSTYGKPYQYFDYDGKFNSYYRGEKMKRVYPRTILYFLKYLSNIKKWVNYNFIVRRKSIFRSNILKLR